MRSAIAISFAFIMACRAQQAGTNQAETHPGMSWKRCTAKNSCQTVSGKITLDSNWRWAHVVGGYTNCYTGNEWNATVCTNNQACAKNCAIEGADYTKTYGITASGDSLKLNFVTEHEYGTNLGGRTYLMQDDTRYQMFNLINNEFTFDVDVSKLPCGTNGALYFVEMAQNGGMGKNNNQAGAKYGTGYCDAQCPRDLKWIDGLGNVEGWQPSDSDKNAGVGNRGACCAEMDIWEANSISNAYTPHSCDNNGLYVCTGDRCGGTYSATRYAGTCDPDGCDYNPYRMGVKNFYGKGKTVDTSKKFTVVTQFIGSGSTLTDIRRKYVQNGKVIDNPQSTIPGVTGNSLTKAFCDAQKAVFGDEYTYKQHGEHPSMGAAMARGMVLVMSLWDDHYASMMWLDSTYPTESPDDQPGIARGECPEHEGDPEKVESQHPDASTTFSNIRFGPIDSTY